TPNRIGGGSTDPRDGGLTPFGVEIVQRMNQVGMAVDVFPCAGPPPPDAGAASGQPGLGTPSHPPSPVPPNAPCKTDEAIKRVAASGGVMGITMIRSFVCATDPVTLDKVLDHVDHVSKLVGVEHVGVGTDVDLDGRERWAVQKKIDLDGLHYSKKIY